MDTPTKRLPLTSADPLADRLARLRELFPEAAGEGRVDLEKLRAVLAGGAVGPGERYGLSWAGKSDALKAIQLLTAATLLPAPGESVNWDTTSNAIIEGDNLEVLKVLQHAYYGKVKFIYIDPPYNTGGDFIYPDDYTEGLGSYLKFTGQVSAGGVKLTTNVDTSGRFHSRWLTMMYPRLFLARNLLREDGMIFVSIDDHEIHNLRLIMDEIFGEENFVAQLVWDRNRKNDARYFSVGHEYMLVYFRNEGFISERGLIFRLAKEGVDELRSLFEKSRKEHGDDWHAVAGDITRYFEGIPKDDPRQALIRFTKVDVKGPFRDDGNINWPGGGGPRYEVLHPTTKKPCKVPVSGWRYPTPERFWEEVERGRIVFGPDETTVPRVRTNLFENSAQVMSSVHYSYAQTASNQFTALFDGARVFENPKPTDDIKRLIAYTCDQDDLILDFFAGSGTTAQAVLELNKEDGGNRRFVLVQLPEPTGREDFPTIAEITKERVRRVIKRMEGERSGELAIGDGPKTDLGFRVFKLAESNFAIWNPELAATEPEALAKQWQLSADNVRPSATETALLYELMLKSGLPLHASVVPHDAGGVPVYLLDDGRALLCLARELTREQLRAMAELKPQSVLCLDVAFKGNDALKVNAQLEFQSHGIQFRTA